MLGLVQSPVFDPTLCIVDDSQYGDAMALLKAAAEPFVAVRADWCCPHCGGKCARQFRDLLELFQQWT
jgi:rubredoxin